MFSVRHPNVVSYIGIHQGTLRDRAAMFGGNDFRTKRTGRRWDMPWMIIMELCEHGDLYSHLHFRRHGSEQNVPWAERLGIACDVAHGMHYIHDVHHKLHLDLKRCDTTCRCAVRT